MNKVEANRAVVRTFPEDKVELSLWSHGTEMTLIMSNDEAIQKAADILNAVAANRTSVASPK